MSRIVEFTSYGAPEVIKFKDVPDPHPAAGEVRINVKAIGLTLYPAQEEASRSTSSPIFR